MADFKYDEVAFTRRLLQLARDGRDLSAKSRTADMIPMARLTFYRKLDRFQVPWPLPGVAELERRYSDAVLRRELENARLANEQLDLALETRFPYLHDGFDPDEEIHMYCTVDAETGEFDKISDSFVALTGYKRSELRHTPASVLTWPDEAVSTKVAVVQQCRALKAAPKGTEFHLRSHLYSKNGLRLELSTRVHYCPTENVYVCDSRVLRETSGADRDGAAQVRMYASLLMERLDTLPVLVVEAKSKVNT